MLALAVKRGAVQFRVVNLRDFTYDVHRTTDDRPYGGGPGMVMMPGPMFDCFEHVQGLSPESGRVVLLTPQGKRFDQRMAREFSVEKRLILISGRYEGFDERIRLGLKPRELSIGDWVLSGGETAAMVVIDAVVRLVPGALGDDESTEQESFSAGLLEYPQYPRPREFRGMVVPDVLISGHHEDIRNWRREQSEKRTRERRVLDSNEKPGREDGQAQ